MAPSTKRATPPPWHRWLTVAGGLLLLLALLPLQAVASEEESAAESGEKILLQVDRKLQPESFELFAQVNQQFSNGRSGQFSLYVIKGKGKKAAALLLAPEEWIGRAVLRTEDTVWMHVPGELELRPATLLQSMQPGLFNHADLLLTDFSVDYTATLLEKNETSYLLELRPRHDRLPYTKQLMQVDRRSKLPTSLRQFGANGVLLKSITFSQTNDLHGFPRPTLLQAVSGSDSQTTATWQLGSIKRRSVPDETFSKEFLPKIGTASK
ncbi:MAG: outer membrane lipoprotein-sorting protein [Magnetococcales bacterium]|nr:outer membrane lipoprotein-sorting protein [Magnetococcales bacterium]